MPGARASAAPASCHTTGVFPSAATMPVTRDMNREKSAGSVPRHSSPRRAARAGRGGGEVTEHVAEELVGGFVVDPHR
ncbi:hypothetical protein [Tessaracoccus coleopterorum]|uniref:hypothetical protein n=1 Tax=Tessaracoccus coleopterorum TaxID=2714950 RepID=UPI001E43D79E|nr:hypothetical protein [Tessaracoccus coleopterorum]